MQKNLEGRLLNQDETGITGLLNQAAKLWTELARRDGESILLDYGFEDYDYEQDADIVLFELDKIRNHYMAVSTGDREDLMMRYCADLKRESNSIDIIKLRDKAVCLASALNTIYEEHPLLDFIEQGEKGYRIDYEAISQYTEMFRSQISPKENYYATLLKAYICCVQEVLMQPIPEKNLKLPKKTTKNTKSKKTSAKKQE